MLRWLRPPVPTVVHVGDAGDVVVGVLADGDGVAGQEIELELTTTRFEALRWRLGRRSRHQLASMAWSADPAPVLDHLVVFGPAAGDLVE